MSLRGYRQLKVMKRVAGGKVRKYTNLAVFNKECSTRLGGNICELTNIRKLRDGSGLATVKSKPGVIRGRAGGTWLLHFADHGILKRHLLKRVGEDARLAGARARRRKRR